MPRTLTLPVPVRAAAYIRYPVHEHAHTWPVTNEHLTMKIHLLLVTVGFLLSLFCLGQNPPVIVWQTSHGGSWEDQGLTVVQSTDGGYIVSGHTYSPDFDIIGHHGSPGSPDALVLKYDANGALLWQKCLGGTGGEVAFDMVATSNGGCVLACSASSTNGDVLGVMGGTDIWLVGLAANGAILWQQTFGGSGSDWIAHMYATADGGTVISCETQSGDGDVSFNHGITDIWVAKLDQAGVIEWENSFGGTDGDYVSGVVQNAMGGYYISGYTQSNDGDVVGNHGGTFDAWVLRLDDVGNLLWQRTLGGSASDRFMELSEDHSGGVVCIGSSSSVDGDLPGNEGGGDLWVVDLDSTGTLQWQHNYGYGSNDGGRCIKRSADGGYFVGGSTSGPNGTDGGLWIMELDAVGDMVWNERIGGRSGEEAMDLIIDSNDDLVLTGWASGGDGDLSDNHGLADVWTVKMTLAYATLTGSAFVDTDADGSWDVDENPLAGHAIRNLETELPYFSDENGAFTVVAMDVGTTTIAPIDPPHHNSAPSFHEAVFPTLVQQVDPGNDFAFQAQGIFNDLAVSLTPVGIFRHLHEVHYTVSYLNLGTTTITEPVLRFAVDPLLTYHSASVVPSSIVMDTLIWQLPPIEPYGSGTIDVFVSVPLSTPLGTTLASIAFIDPVLDDANVANNSAGWEVIATGSADPNDILVDRAEVQFDELDPVSPYLEYVIRFQNTGNDTAFVVWIENAVPDNADLSSFQFVSSSHPVQIEYLQHVGRFTFTFNNILLADSNVNEAASHGFMRYRIRPRSTLMVGDSVLNSAGIYFDYNAPVITNTAHTVIENSVGLSDCALPVLTLSPNPGPGQFRIEAGTARSGIITVADATGRVLQQVTYNGSRTLDLTGHVPGIYFVTLSTDNTVVTGKVIIKR